MEKVFESKKVDYEGMQVMRTLATNMVFLMESIALGKDKWNMKISFWAVWISEVVSARRSGCTATFDELNKFFTLSNMPVATSWYWNNIYGWDPGEGKVDYEGMQVMRTLATNMVFLMESIALGKEKNGLPEYEDRVWTNFTR